MSQKIIERATEIITKNTVNGEEYMGQYCVLALIDLEGYPTASVITPLKANGIKQIWLCTGLASDKVKRLEKCDRASICFSSADYNISLVGQIEIKTDIDTKKEMWFPGLEHHFSGIDDPNYCVLCFTTSRYNFFVDGEEVQGYL
ncbi:MAG: pyridoxamine 5'-phosphate oxidase family protein [Candidatus Cloacimonetes bacterium]|nr:pyridoxamine 5'-phosphate oxidase family protein [Candidatus Cloacimonadota bacterium]